MKISIIIPTYNCGQYLEKAILSVLNQPYPNKELIVIDGKSTDNTLEILDKYEDKITWISEKDSGQSDAINKGFKMATGEIITWLNADDYYESNIFGEVINKFKSDKSIVVVHGKCNTVNLKGEVINTNIPPANISLKKMLSTGNLISQPASFLRTKTVQQVGYLNDKLNYWMEYDLFIKLAKIGKISFIDETLTNFTKREDQKSNPDNRLEMDEELIQIQKQHGASFLNVCKNTIKKDIRKYLNKFYVGK